MRRGFIALLLVGFAFSFLASCASVGTVKEIANTEAAFKVEVWTDRLSATYEVGNEITYVFKSEKDAYVTLFNILPGGKVQVLFPNGMQKDSFVKGKAAVRVLPDNADKSLVVAGPAGTTLVKAIATVEKKELVAAADMKANGLVSDVTKTEAELADSVSGILNTLDKKNWSFGEVVVTIEK